MDLGMHKSQLILWTSVNYIPHSAQSFAVGIFYGGSRPTSYNPLWSTENIRLCPLKDKLESEETKTKKHIFDFFFFLADSMSHLRSETA